MTRGELRASYEQFGCAVFKRCRALLRDEAMAKDALQETFLRLWARPEGFEAATSRMGWLQRVAERVCFDLMASTTRAREEPLTDAHHGLRLQPSAERRVEDRDVLLRFIERFDERTRHVALLHYLDGLTQEQIAELTGWSRHTVGKKLQFLAERARVLRPLLTQEPNPC
ncbi:MAG: sigma-70 family RNA polymerase sigma factor [Archangiaceae bacterium]|nr:sigma-70 family RNA polymerase sigma factor [Archangiaceae bacterium]